MPTTRTVASASFANNDAKENSCLSAAVGAPVWLTEISLPWQPATSIQLKYIRFEFFC
jgi:hypothetical protein